MGGRDSGGCGLNDGRVGRVLVWWKEEHGEHIAEFAELKPLKYTQVSEYTHYVMLTFFKKR